MLSWLQRRRGKPETTVPIASTGLLPVLSADVLLSSTARQAWVREIAHHAAVPDSHFESLYRSVLAAFATFVQQLPASEMHHHAVPGGLLDHTLKVAALALGLRRGYLLPPGAEPEELDQKHELWTYAVFTAALLHDLGKPAADQRVILYDNAGRACGIWNPWRGAMRDELFYRIEFIFESTFIDHTSGVLCTCNMYQCQCGFFEK